MSNYSAHNENLPSAVSGISDTGGLKAGKNSSANFVATVQRQSFQGEKKKPEGWLLDLIMVQSTAPHGDVRYWGNDLAYSRDEFIRQYGEPENDDPHLERVYH